MIDHGIVEEPVERPRGDRIREAHLLRVGQDDDADIPVELHADIRAEAVGAAVVPDDVAVRR
jgi:hypothetical protein